MDGNVINATCLVDADCPGGLLCYNNVSWSELESFCACSTWYKKTGEECGELLGAGAYVALGISVVTLSLRVIFLLWALADIVRLICVYGRRLEFNATYTTYFFCTASMAFGVSTGITYQYESLDVWTEDTVIVYEAGHKEHFIHPISVVGLAMGQTFTFLMLLNLSVMWVEVSQRAKRVTVVTSKNVSRYRRVSIAVGTVFSLIVTTLVVLDMLSYSTVVLLPFTLSLMVVVFIGRRGMMNVLREAVERTLATSSSAEESKRADSTRAVLNGIARSSKWMLIFTGLLVISGSLYALTLMAPGGWKEGMPIGQFHPTTVLSTAGTTAMMLLQFVTFYYCHNSVKRSFKRQQDTASSTSPSSSAGTKEWASSVGHSDMQPAPFQN